MSHIHTLKMKRTLLALASLSLVNCYRLPKSIIPESYRLDIITPFGEQDNFEFKGKVWIKTLCKSPTTNITLHSKSLQIKENEVRVKDITTQMQKVMKVLRISYEKEFDFLVIVLDRPLTKDRRYEVYIPFQGELIDGTAGFYRSSYVDLETKERHWLGVTQFEATHARRAFPCFDEPAMKATFEISIGRKYGYRSISNMPLLFTERMEGKPGWYWDRFDVSVPMSTYLVAYLVSDFEYKESEVHDGNNVTFRIWCRKDALDQVNFAKEVGPKALRFYEEFFDISYPLPKQDMVALPEFSMGAMENWGLITYRESELLYDPTTSSKSRRHPVATTICHELAHQWFGNLVTMKWWTDLWLNEGFATYMINVAVHHLFPQWNSLAEQESSSMTNVFAFDALRSSHPVSVPIGDPKEIEEMFDAISYQKGSCLIRMMSLFLGEETIKAGVSNYLKRHRYQNAEQDDLWNSLTKAAHEKGTLDEEVTVKEVMDTWTLQTGYPVLTVSRDYENGHIILSQERFFRDTSKLKDDDNPCWWIPLTYTTESEKEFNNTTPKDWLTCPNDKEFQVLKNIASENEWVLFNIQMSSLYRVNYDEKNWALLSNALKYDSESIPILNRVQLITDAAGLSYIGSLKYDEFFNLLRYLKDEEEYLPWKAAIRNTVILRTHLKCDPNYRYFKKYMQSLLAPMYEKMGRLLMNKKDNFDELEKIKFQEMIASASCLYQVQQCIDDAKALFKTLQSGPDKPNPIPKDFAQVVYCTALRYGGEDEWSIIWEKYERSNVAAERQSLLGVLGCTRQIRILNRYLNWSLDDGKIRRQDVISVFTSVASNDVGYNTAKEFFYRNIKTILKQLNPNLNRISMFLSSIANEMQEPLELQEFESFIRENRESFSAAKKSVEQALETVKINTQWQKRHREEMYQILQKLSDGQIDEQPTECYKKLK